MSVDAKFTIVFSRMNKGQAVIDSLRSVALAGMPYAAKIVDLQHRSFVSELSSSGQLEKLIIRIKDPHDLRKTADFLCEKMTEQALKNASYSVDAASLVFAHTVLDDALSSFLEISSEVATSYWKDRVRKKQVELDSIMDGGLEDVLGSLIKKEIWAIRRNDSVIKKAELLHAICKPSEGPVHPEYKFDPEKLKEVDKLRQDIVHGDLLGGAIPEIEKNLAYMRDSWMYFFVMMHKSFGLRIDPTALFPSAHSPK